VHSIARRGVLGIALSALLTSCATSATSLVQCPLSPEQQQQAVLEIVPRGTSRTEAERRLRTAGIEYSPGQRNSIYYLGLWNRSDGRRWHINVALLFDKDGRLYQTRPGDSATEPLTDDFRDQSRRQADATSAGGTAGTGSDSGDELQVPFPDQAESTKSRR